MRTILPVCLAGFAVTALPCQATFTQVLPTTAPSARAGAIGVTDGNVLFHFGGKPTSTTETNDLWMFDGVDWLDVTPTSGPLPPARDWYAATYDLGRGRLVLFGGRSTALGVNLGDTWEYDGFSWTQRTPATSPSARRWCQMAYDVSMGLCILFGGFDNNVYDNETWSWDGTDWTLLSPTTSPSVRGRGRMSYDLVRGQIVYFGGRDTVGAKNDTWVWHAGDWQQVVTAHAPTGGRFAYGMTYDELRDRHVLYGGTVTGPTLGDVWEFDGVDWTQRANGPAGRTGPTFTYVPGLATTVLFGGFSSVQLGDTWTYQTAALPSVSGYGSGCAGPGGNLTYLPTSEPWAGDVFESYCATLGPTSLGLVVAGLGQVSVPLHAVLPIAPLGCDLLVTPDVVLGPVLPIAGVVTTQFPLPATASLAGLAFYEQIAELQFDLLGNWVGLFVSNALAMTVGVR